MKKKFWGLTSLVGAAAAIGVAFVVVPALGTSHDAVTYDAKTAIAFTHGPTTQSLVNGDGCLLSSSSVGGPLVALSSTGNGNKGPGLVGTAIGVKTGGSNGTPCSFTEERPDETLTLTSLGDPWVKLELDVELKDNAWVRVTLSTGETYDLVSGSSIVDSGASLPDDETFPYEATSTLDGSAVACANPSDSGPDSGGNDNCFWTIDPGVTFTSFTIDTIVGNVSLEGGADDPLLQPTKFYFAPFSTVDDPVTTDEDTPILPFNVLANDVSADGATVKSITDLPDGVTVEDLAAGVFSFDPTGVLAYQQLNVDDPDTVVSFQYTAETPEGDTSTARVILTVSHLNDAPESATTEPIEDTVDEDSTENDPLSIAEDIDDDSLTLTCALEDGSIPEGVVDNGDGTITYTPPADFFGIVDFECTATDGGSASSEPITVVITVTALNDPPVAVDDTGTMDDRAFLDLPDDDPDAGVVLTSNVKSFPVVDNDTDVDDANVDLSVASVGIPATTAYSDLDGVGTATASPDLRSVVFTPDIEWPDGVFALDVTIPYDVRDDEGASDPGSSGLLTITVERVICSDETVSDLDEVGGETAFGSFTLLSDLDICKNYSVFADAADQTVTFVPGDGPEARFLGELSFTPSALTLEEGVFNVFSAGLSYDPGTGERPLQACLDPVFNSTTGEFESATFPLTPETDDGDETESWCLVRVTGTAVGSDGEMRPDFLLYGKEDPTFKFR